MTTISFRLTPLALAAALAAATPVLAQTDTAITEPPADEATLEEVRVLGTAEDELRQALGSSVITQEDLERRPPANDLSEIIRTMPGVNLTGASSSGSYGNQRQIDLRGMGPENTLVLIDGKPVQSRNSAQMRRSGERDSNGDTNWVPADQVERIEVIRGPAAARYGSGAAGGVVNIITKKPTDKLSGSATAYYLSPEDSMEGGTKRLGFNLSGPLSERLSFRLYGNIAKTDRDDPNINAADSVEVANTNLNRPTIPAGREGLRNRDINGLLRWDLTPNQVLEFESGFSRQGNIYAGEYTVGLDPRTASMIPLFDDINSRGAEVRRTYRDTFSVTHRGKWGDLGSSRLLLQYENTRNLDCFKGTAGTGEGTCLDPVFDALTPAQQALTSPQLRTTESQLRNYYVNGEFYAPLKLGGLDQVLTTGLEFRRETLDDPVSLRQTQPNGSLPTGSKSQSTTFAAYVEDNIAVTSSFTLTPGVRFDSHDQSGTNWSPSLNATYEVTPQVTVKGGIARAFKAPNLYQTNPNYWYFSMGMGCPINTPSGPCYIQGNPDLLAETSVNKEIGVAWNNHQGWDASLTYFRNDYKNKITADMPGQPVVDMGTYRYYQWVNAGKALIHGLEGNFNIPLLGTAGNRLKLINNFTWMFKNKNIVTDQPLSIIPKYTVNSTLDWRATQKFSAQATATFYGPQEARSLTDTGSNTSGTQLAGIGSYTLVGLGGVYQFNKNYRASFGVLNVFDKTIKRRSNGIASGAFTYNEPGRAYYVSFTGSF